MVRPFEIVTRLQVLTCLHQAIVLLYTAKLSSGKTFAVFAVFQPIAKVFPLNHLLCTVHDGHGLMLCENFPVNSVFCAQTQKFSHSKVLVGNCKKDGTSRSMNQLYWEKYSQRKITYGITNSTPLSLCSFILQDVDS